MTPEEKVAIRETVEFPFMQLQPSKAGLQNYIWSPSLVNGIIEHLVVEFEKALLTAKKEAYEECAKIAYNDDAECMLECNCNERIAAAIRGKMG